MHEVIIQRLISVFDLFSSMPAKETHHPGGRITRLYNPQERAAIDPFKSDYLAATSPGARKTIAQTCIFPALWNYWQSIGQVTVVDDDEMRLRTEVNHISSDLLLV